MTQTKIRVPYSYLGQQFSGAIRADILRDIERVVDAGDFTLGKKVQEFEEAFAEVCGVQHAIGVNSGTDALFLIMKALGIGTGDSVVTVPNTFMATVGAILATGARPVFVDIGDDYLMGINEGLKLSSEVKEATKLILPVQWGGDSTIIDEGFLGHPHRTKIIYDACQAVGGMISGKPTGSLPGAVAFSLHPLKNVQIWGDGGIIATNDQGLADDIRLLRNHGLFDRNTWLVPGFNSRLHTIQAVVGLHTLKNVETLTEKRIANARRYDEGLRPIPQVTIPPRHPNHRHVYHLFQIQAELRDKLLAYLLEQGVDCKVHYPVALHLQPALKYLGYERGDFPRAERFADTHITLPVHEFLSTEQIDYVIDCITQFYRGR